MCSLCSRLRRGTLYDKARELGCNKLALGHHRDDIIETFFLNLFFGGKMEAMPPKYKIDQGDLMVIRPLAYCKEEEIISYSQSKNYPIILIFVVHKKTFNEKKLNLYFQCGKKNTQTESQ